MIFLEITMKKNEILDKKLVNEIKSLLNSARETVASTVNTTLLRTYWQIGKMIVEDEQKHSNRAEYGKQTLKLLSKVLTNEFGRGFSRSNLQNMRLLYLSHQKCQTLSSKLSWSHYCELLLIDDDKRRAFYEKECVDCHWSVRELKRQINSSLFERLLLSDGEPNKEKVLSLALRGNEIAKKKILSKTHMYSSFWDCQKTNHFWKVIWKQHLSNKLKSFYLNSVRDLCL